jgi:tellurite resistance protein TerC
MGKPAWVWLTFVGIVVALLAFDLGVLHKDDKEIGVRESLLLSAGYISVALLFGAWVWWYLGAQSGMDYYTGFMIEKSLSMDNVFVIALIFSFFAIPRQYQHRVLFWGILGVIVLRAIMIGLGATLVSQFSWVLYLFGAFLIFTGIKMWIIADHMPDIANNPLLKFLKRHMRVTDGLRGNAFWVRETDPKTGKLERFATPLFLALVLVEFVDLIFAVDSVPAIFAITTDPFIVYTSNIFAILGLRALYFALAAMIHRFKYLKYALALVLVFIGSKIFLVGIIGKIPGGDLAERDLRPDRRWCAGVAVEDPGAARCRRVHMTPPIVQRLREAAAAIHDERVSMRAMAQAHGPEAHGTLLLLLAMPCLLPVPGVGTVLGLGMAALAVAMWRGHCTPCLPQRVAELELPPLGPAGPGRVGLCLRAGRAPCPGTAEPSRHLRPTVCDGARRWADGRHRRDADSLRQPATCRGAGVHRAGAGVSRWGWQ